jgi:hypothetical protein
MLVECVQGQTSDFVFDILSLNLNFKESQIKRDVH